MDAATLFIVMSLNAGPKRTITQKFPSMEICTQVADDLRKKASLRTTTHYCVKRKPDAEEQKAIDDARRRATAAFTKQKRAAAQAKASAQAKAQLQAQAQAQQPGMPRDFFTGPTPSQN